MPRIRTSHTSPLRCALPSRASSLHLALAALTGLGLAGCGAGIEGPSPSLSEVSPRIVCGGTTARVVLKGAGLSAVPVGTLGGKVTVAPPRIFLRRVEDIKTGDPAMDAPVQVPDDPAHPETAHVHSISDTELAFDITPEMALPSGVYSIDVLSPSAPDLKSASVEKALALVAAATAKTITPGMACLPPGGLSVTVKGDGFVAIDGAHQATVKMTPANVGGATKTYTANLNGCKPLPMDILPGHMVEVCSEVAWAPQPGDLPEDDATIEISSEGGMQACAAATTKMTVLPAPKVDGVARGMLGATICGEKTAQPLTVTGSGFAKGANVFIQGTAAKTTFVDPTKLTADFSALTGLTPGISYEVTVSNMDGCKGSKAMVVQAVAGPEILFVDPPSVWTGIQTPVAIYARTINGKLGNVEFARNGAAMQVWTKLTVALDPNHDKRILTSIPKGLAPASYDLRVTDGSGCPTVITKAFSVVDNGGPKITTLSRPTGAANTALGEVITGTGFVSVPSLFLSPSAGGAAAIPVSAVQFVSATTLVATFPPVPAGSYDVVVLNSDGTVGVLQKGFTAGGAAPPRVDSITPAVFNADIKIAFTINGANFHDMAMKPVDVTLTCSDKLNRLVQVLQPSPTSLKCTATDFSSAVPGTTCTVRVTNGDDMGFTDFAGIAISNPNGGAVTGKLGPKTRSAHQGPATALLAPAGSPHYLVVAGGDSGDLMKGSLLDAVETVQVDGTGPQGAFVLQRSKLPAPISRAGGAALGRYFYFVGGYDGAAALKTVYRAKLLDPAQAPAITDSYLEPAVGMGITAGRYSYRVAAQIDVKDPDNPGGESVASEPWVVAVPSLMSGAQVTLTWKKVSGAIGYSIYRSPMGDGGSEQLIGQVGDVAQYTDMGGMPMVTPPQLSGSLGKWVALATLGTARQSPSVVIAADPMKAGTFYLYAVGGSDGMAALASYELLPINVDANGVHSSPPQWTAGAEKLAKARTMGGAWVYSAGGTTYLYAGGGQNNNVLEPSVEVAAITPNTGALGKFTDTTSMLPAWGFASASAGAQLLTVGNNVPDTKLYSSVVGMTPLTIPAFAAAGNAVSARLLPGAAIDGPILFVAGGLVGGMATNDTEWMVY